MLTLALAGTAVFAGLAGTWSPCGLSVIDTIGRAASRGGRSIGVLTFAAGCVAGGVITFGGLALAGRLLLGPATDSGLAVTLAIAIALASAIADSLGLRVAPQIRRQVPEGWRRRFPAPVTLGLYGLLLGLGFTTFVLSFAAWGLAVIALLVASPAVGVVVGAAFGLGRALPMLATLPSVERLSERLQGGMRPRRLRAVRGGAAAAALLTALTLALDSEEISVAASVVAGDAADVSVAGDAMAWRLAGGGSVVMTRASRDRLPEPEAAVGGTLAAVRGAQAVRVHRLRDNGLGSQLASFVAPDVTGVAVSDAWVVWRQSPAGGPELLVAAPAAGGPTQIAAQARRGELLSRPSLDGSRLVFARNSSSRSSISLRDLSTGSTRVLRATTTTTQLRNPSLRGQRLLFVQAHACYQRLQISALARNARPRTLLETGGTALRDRGYVPGRTTQGRKATMCPRGSKHRIEGNLAGTALGENEAYVTQLLPSAAGDPAPILLSTPAG